MNVFELKFTTSTKNGTAGEPQSRFDSINCHHLKSECIISANSSQPEEHAA